ncbi:hypothetical protein RvY_03272 [Ramazzottius varieornatus]|uniref:Uncharacterized protein n=1 Tax=Ramazzottius varieornatus TaxID=947166 RepID=A0A1D1UNA2_RAMVA|nr:hypothetical protein RvY_03272 [Ramazzottius varieornatus]
MVDFAGSFPALPPDDPQEIVELSEKDCLVKALEEKKDAQPAAPAKLKVMMKPNGALYRDATLEMVNGQRTRDAVFSIGGNEDSKTFSLASQADTSGFL